MSALVGGPVLQAGLVMVKERASRKGVELSLQVAADAGRVEVGARRADGWVEVAVADSGVGIAPEEQGRVFEEFGQARSASGQSEGTGLGLTLCRRFVELHGGTSRIASEVGRGSTFMVALPVRQPAPVGPGSPAPGRGMLRPYAGGRRRSRHATA